MERQIKKTIKAGNSSAVLLPRAWLNKEVRVELVNKSKDIILAEVISLLTKHIELKKVIGIYLVGSFAREEEDEKSDIDILVISDDIDKEMVHEGLYNILIMSRDLLKQKLENDLFPIGQMINEAKPLMNAHFLKGLEVKITKKNLKWYIDTTRNKLDLLKNIIDNRKINDKKMNDRVAYTLILRLRTLYIIKCLIHNETYSKKEFIRTIKKVSGSNNAYESYLRVKNNLFNGEGISIDEIKRLYEYLIKDLDGVKKQVL